MKIALINFLTVAILFSSPSYGWDYTGYTLVDALHTSLSQNPKTRANDSRIKAMEARTRAAWLNMLPSVSANYGIQKTTGHGVQDGQIIDGYTKNNGYTVGLSANIFNGGIDKLTAEAQEHNTQAVKDQLNGTNGYIPNTKGSMAIVVVDTFLELSSVRQQLEFYKKTLSPIVDLYLKAAEKNQNINEVDSVLSFQRGMNDDLIIFADLEDRLKDDFKYIVTLPAPSNLEDFQSTINSQIIPENVEKAVMVGLEKNSEMKSAKSRIAATDKDYQASQRRVLSPRVDLVVSKNVGTTNAQDFNYKNNDTYVGLNFSIGFSPSSTAHVQAAAEEKNVARYERDSAADDLDHNLRALYKTFESNNKIVESYKKNYEISQKNVQVFLDDIEAGKKIDIDKALDRLREVLRYWDSINQTNKNIVRNKFNIQRVAGTLFENVGIPD